MKTLFSFLSVLLLAAFASAGQPAVNSKASDISLTDQRGNEVTLHSFAGKPVVLLASDREGSKQNKAWIKALTGYPGSHFVLLGAADLRKVPFLLRWYYKRDFARDPATILLDWNGDLFETYGLVPDVANIILIDREGYVRYLHAGSAEPGTIDDLYREIDSVMHVK